MSNRDMLRGIRDERLRNLAKLCLRNGWHMRINGDTHLMLIPPKGPWVVISTTMAGRGRYYKNTRAKLRKAGLDIT
jgi:hypothetical protein